MRCSIVQPTKASGGIAARRTSAAVICAESRRYQGTPASGAPAGGGFNAPLARGTRYSSRLMPIRPQNAAPSVPISLIDVVLVAVSIVVVAVSTSACRVRTSAGISATSAST